MSARTPQISRRTQVTAAMVFGLLIALGYAIHLSYAGSESLKGDFSYQSAVVDAEKDTAIWDNDNFEGAPPENLIADMNEVRRDLALIAKNAKNPDEVPPPLLSLKTRAAFTDFHDKLVELQNAGESAFDATVERNQHTRDISNALFAFVALLFAVLVGRLRRTIEEGRDLVERLQRAFLSTRRAMPGVDVGSVLISATRGSNVGGDTYDAFTFDGRYAVFLVADVSGKGIDAAVDTAFIKYTIRTLFFADHDPARILNRFASIYERTSVNPETFVVLFLAVVDLEQGTLRYASAGHEPAWVVRAGRVDQLPPTGAIVGIMPDETYEANTLTLAPGDTLVVSTDGLTESRDGRGALLGAENVSAWLAEIDGSAQQVGEALVRRLRKRSSSITDDLAILVVRYEPASPAPALGASDVLPALTERAPIS